MGRNSKSKKKQNPQTPLYKKVDNQPKTTETVEKKETTEETKNFEVIEFKMTKSSGKTEQDAIDLALEYLDTFEGNLKADHTKTQYVFTKVRE